MEKAKEISDKGIKDALDPNCVSLFKSSLASAIDIQQKVKAELKAHMNKGKWINTHQINCWQIVSFFIKIN